MSVGIDEDNNPFDRPQSYKPDSHANGLNATYHAPNATSVPDSDDLLYNKDPRYSTMVSINPESRVSRMLKPGIPLFIEIVEASNSSEDSPKKYVVYTIRLTSDALPDRAETRRRYSEFESLRDILVRIFPLVVVPPIPPKNYFNFIKFVKPELVLPPQAEGSASPNNNFRSKLVEHRKRLLQSFLNQCLALPQIRGLEFFAKFLDPNSNWADEVALMSSQLPKSVYQSNPENGLRTNPTYEDMPSPSPSGMKSFVKRGASLLTNDDGRASPDDDVTVPVDSTALDSLNKRIVDSLAAMSTDYAELGAAFNALSLSEGLGGESTPKVNAILDGIGQVFDRSYITITALVGELETKFSEPLSEVVAVTGILHDIGKFEQRKLRQRGLLEQEVANRKSELSALLQAKGQPTTHPVSARPSARQIFSFKKFSQYVSDIIDQNPEQTRNARINALTSKLASLERCQKIMSEDLAYISDEIAKNHATFHRKQLKSVYDILAAYNRFLINWARKNCDIWEEVREEVQKL
ncbi:sorting nexin-41 [Diutina catenulata]